MDLILSSGFLAFGRHLGFLRAMDTAGPPVQAMCGTSSGALIAALRAAGLDNEAMCDVFRQHPRPLRLMRPARRPWRGLMELGPLLALLRALLPARFEQLQVPLAVGVRTASGGHRLLHEGPLPEAVVASCAIPMVFAPVTLAGEALSDGGAVDRLGIDAWRNWRPGRQGIVHRVQPRAGREPETDTRDLRMVQTPASRASFWSLGDLERQTREAEEITRGALAAGRT